MKGIYWFFFILLFTFKNSSQEHSNVLFSIDNENFLTANFVYVCKNNLKVIAESNTNSIQINSKFAVNQLLKKHNKYTVHIISDEKIELLILNFKV